ncbi:MAG: DMT family transporter [Thaumarchaeota archaeon]|nr:DMT family transporter [Nitrososphaerota archaeon]
MNDIGLGSAISSMLARGLNKVPVRMSLLRISESLATTIASLVAMAVFGSAIVLFGWGPALPSLYALMIFAVVGIVNAGVGRLFVWKSIAQMGANRGNIVGSTQNGLAIIFAFFFLGEAVTGWLIAGFALILLAVIIILYDKSERSFTSKQIRDGMIYGAMGAVCWGAGQDLMKAGITSYSDPIGASFLTFSFSMIFLVPYLFLRPGLKATMSLRGARQPLLFAVLGGLIGNAGSFLSYVALSYIPVTLVATINAVNPIVTFMASYLLIRKSEGLNLRVFVSVLLAVTGLLMATLH